MPPSLFTPRGLGLLLTACAVAATTLAQSPAAPPAKDEFSPLVKLAPFVVNGQSLAISIYARTRSDRSYGEKFAEGVAKVVYETVTESTGKGLVIIGAKGEPHPNVVFQKFLALASDGKLDPAIAARGPELSKMLNHWRDISEGGKSRNRGKSGKMDFDFDKIITALPLPLEGVGAKLYQLAWEEKFDDAKVDAKLRALRPEDLERRDLFKAFDWVFYLPPKGAFDRVLDDIIAEALKQEEVGFFMRATVKTAMLVMKPRIRRAIEGARQGMMFATVVQARTRYSKTEVSALTKAYIGVFTPKKKSTDDSDEDATSGSDHDRVVRAVRERLKQIQAKADLPTEGPGEN